MSMMSTNIFWFTVLNPLPASINRTASKFSSSNMECNACTAASQPTSWLAHSWADPTDEIESSHRADKTTLPVISLCSSAIPVVCSPGILSSGINLLARNISKLLDEIFSEQSFSIRLSIALHNPVSGPQKCLIERFDFQPSVSITDGSDSPLVFRASFLTKTSYWFVRSGSSGRRTLFATSADCGCFYLRILTV